MNLGDVVGYNASPNEVCERVRAMGAPVVRGNHDRACSGLTDLSEFNLVAAMSARWTQITLANGPSRMAAQPAARADAAWTTWLEWSLCTALRAMKMSTC